MPDMEGCKPSLSNLVYGVMAAWASSLGTPTPVIFVVALSKIRSPSWLLSDDWIKMEAPINAAAPRQHHEHPESQVDQDKNNRSAKDSETLSLTETLTDRQLDAVNGRSSAKSLSNSEALDDLRKRIEDWKGYDVTTFGDLLLHGKLRIVSSTQSKRAKKVMISLFFI